MVQAAEQRCRAIIARGGPGERAALQGEIDTLFDAGVIARAALKRHWKTLAPAQRVDMVDLVRQLVVLRSVRRLKAHLRYPVIYSGERTSNGVVQVQTVATQKRRGRIVRGHITYFMRKEVGGAWRAEDYTRDGASFTRGLRKRFNRTVRRRGADGLIRKLRGQVERERKRR